MEREDHLPGIRMAVSTVAALAAVPNKTCLQQEKLGLLDAESLVLIAGHQLLEKLLSLAHAMENARKIVQRQAQFFGLCDPSGVVGGGAGPGA